MGKYMAYIHSAHLDKETDALVAKFKRGGGNFSAWVREKIREEMGGNME